MIQESILVYMKICSRLALVAVLMLSLLGCQPSTPPSSVARLNIKEEPQTLDPRKARRLNDQAIIHMLFDGLCRVGKEGKAELAIAKEVEISADLKTYTFHLRDAHWSNMEKVTAYDFAYTWRKILSPDYPSDFASSLYVIKNGKQAKEGRVPLSEVGILALDEKTLIVELEESSPQFLELVALTPFSAVNAKLDQENPHWMHDANTFVGNGPFVLSKWDHQHQLMIKRNPLYWDASTVRLEGIALEMVEEETEFKLFEKQELDWAGSPLSAIPVDALSSLKEEGLLKKKEGLGTMFLRLNTHHPVLGNVKMRKALGLAIHRQQIVDHVLRGGQSIALGLIPNSFGFTHPPYFQDADADLAKQLFTEALQELNLTVEAFPELVYLYRQSNSNHLLAQEIQQEWRSLFGIEVRLEAIEAKVFFDRVSKTDYMIAFGSWIGDFSDPINFLNVFKEPKGSNNTYWEDLEYNALLSRSTQEKDPVKRTEILLSAEQKLMEGMPIIPLYYWNLLYLESPRLKEVVLSPLGQIDFKWASIEEVR